MLHIILGILKVIGILLGFLFLFLLAMLLAVLFCSVRYQVQAEKQPNRTEGKVKISWLFHIVSVAFSVDSSRKAFLSIRLFGIRLPVPGKKKVRKGHRRKGAKQKKQKHNDKPQNDDVPTEVSEEVMGLTEEVSEKVKEGVSETIDVTEALILEPDDTTDAPILKEEHTAHRPISEIHEGSFWQKIRNFIFNKNQNSVRFFDFPSGKNKADRERISAVVGENPQYGCKTGPNIESYGRAGSAGGFWKCGRICNISLTPL